MIETVFHVTQLEGMVRDTAVGSVSGKRFVETKQGPGQCGPGRRFMDVRLTLAGHRCRVEFSLDESRSLRVTRNC